MPGPTDISYQSPLPAIAQLLSTLIGTKGKESSTSSTTGDTSSLQALLANISDPQNLQNLVSQLFAQGAAQVPGLTAQYANATGTRTTNNSMLGQSLAQLNQSLASSIAQAIQQQQQLAVQAAGKIADVNKTTQTNGTKATGPNVKNAATTAAVTTAGGYALNKFGKKVTPDADAAKPVDVSSSIPDFTTPQNGPSVIPPAVDFGNDAPLSAGAVNFSAPSAADIANSATAANYTSNVADTLGGDVTTSLGSVATDVPSIPAGGSVDWGDGFDFTDFFDFADGGRITFKSALDLNAIMAQKRNSIIASGGKVMPFDEKDASIDPAEELSEGDYADGGNITAIDKDGDGKPLENRPKMPPSRDARIVVERIRSRQEQNDTTSGNLTSRRADGKNYPVDVNNTYADGGAVERRGYADGTSVVRNQPQFGAPVSVVGTGSINLDKPQDLIAAGGGGIAGAGAPLTSDALSQMIQHLSALDDATGPAAGTSTGAPNPVATDFVTNDTPFTGVAPAMMAAVNNVATYFAVQEALNVDPDPETPMSPIGHPGGDAAPPSTTTADTDDAEGGPAAAAGIGSAEGAAAAAAGGNDGSSGVWADGGPITTKNKKRAAGIDTIPIMATQDEYMLPVDVADFIGRDVLDDLVATIHIPVRTGTHG